MKQITLLFAIFSLGSAEIATFSLPSPWSYTCDRSNSSIGGHHHAARCIKVPAFKAEKVQGLNACKMTCSSRGNLWPVPTGRVQVSRDLVKFLPQELRLVAVTAPSDQVNKWINQFADVFREYLYLMHPNYEGGYKNPYEDQAFLKSQAIKLTIAVESEDESLTGETDESYTIDIQKSPGKKGSGQDTVHVSIAAPTYFGARHGMETLGQMISYDDMSDTLQIYETAHVEDSPSYSHRGVLLDTSRNFISKKVIKQIISGMSYDKLNVFHWHITDTHSFPFYSRRVPQLTMHGAYSPRQVYTPEDIRDIVEYARLRGVRVLPEFDAPAHVGNGWQFGESEGKGKLAVCVNQEPWQDYCVEPPCGQLNPVNPHVYTTLGKLYQDFFELFDTDMFHMGGDEVNLNCWNTTKEIMDELRQRGQTGTKEELLALWKSFQEQAAQKVYDANGKKLPLILWTNSLTEEGHVERYLSKDDYIIQIWTKGNDSVVKELIEKDFRVIFSNYDAWYLDCGYSSWVGEGNNWCSPYKGWQIVYDNSPREHYRNAGGEPSRMQQILGGEAAMWTEQVDGAAVMHKLWPRVSALGERLWSDPETNWKQAELRMLDQRARQVERGTAADALQPEWCRQNEALCYLRV